MDSEPEIPPDQLADLRRELHAPPTLEGRVVAALKAEGLIRAGASTWSRLAMIAAALLVFTAGAAAGHLLSRSSPVVLRPAQARYLLLLAGDVTPAADGSSRAAEYGQWARSLAARNIAVSGEELTSHAEIVALGPASALPDLASVGGYFLLEADDDAAAAALARTCPHVKYGGSVIVRRVTGRRP